MVLASSAETLFHYPLSPITAWHYIFCTCPCGRNTGKRRKWEG